MFSLDRRRPAETPFTPPPRAAAPRPSAPSTPRAATPSLLDRVAGAAAGVTSWFEGLFEPDPPSPAATPAAPHPHPSGWAQTRQQHGNRDVSAGYHELVAQAKAGENTLPEDAAEYAYLNVPGLFTERFPGYMDENAERMRALGLDTREVPIDTDAGVEENARVLRDLILKIAEEEQRQVVLQGQSKGGVDISAALALYPELREHVRAVVALQAPYGGTPMSTDVHDGKLSGVADAVIENVLCGDRDSLRDLSYDSRQTFDSEHPYPEEVPTVSLATAADPGKGLLGPLVTYMGARHHLASDGAVPVEDQILPGSDVVRLSNMDHAGSVMRLPGAAPSDAPGDVTQALLTLALRKAQEQEDEKRR